MECKLILLSPAMSGMQSQSASDVYIEPGIAKLKIGQYYKVYWYGCVCV